MHLRSLIVIILISVALATFFNRNLLFQSDANATTENKLTNNTQSLAVKVITQPIVETNSGKLFEAIGTGKARLSVNLYPQVIGEVTSVNFKAQDKVKAGEVLVELDNREQKLAVRLAEVEIKGATNLLTRYEQAVKDGAVPESEVDSARADVEAAQVALEQARVALDNRQIKAPFTGVVGIPNIELGDRVDSTTVITGLDDRSVLYVDFEVPESLSGLIQKTQNQPQEIVATTPAFPDETFAASINSLESRLDDTRRTLRVRASIDNQADLLRPGMSFRIRWDIPGELFATVPEISLQWSDTGAYIWIIRDDRANRVPVRVVARTAGKVLVEGDLASGEQVVAEGLQRLREGLQVEILNRERNNG